jgi:hypothetical protein
MQLEAYEELPCAIYCYIGLPIMVMKVHVSMNIIC